jgi:hypothetical protein
VRQRCHLKNVRPVAPSVRGPVRLSCIRLPQPQTEKSASLELGERPRHKIRRAGKRRLTPRERLAGIPRKAPVIAPDFYAAGD